MDNRLGVMFVSFLLAGGYGCSSFRGAQLEGVRVAAAGVEASLQVGVNYHDFGVQLQKLGAEILLAREKGANKKAVAKFSEGFDLYKASYDLWSDKIRLPSKYCCYGSTYVRSVLKRYSEEYKIPMPPYGSDPQQHQMVMQGLWERASSKLKEAKSF